MSQSGAGDGTPSLPRSSVGPMTTNDSGSAPKPPAKDPWDLPDVSDLTVGILGGTGPQGRGLAYRLARAGQRIRIGSRSATRGAEAAAEIAALPGVVSGLVNGNHVSGGDNEYACDA